MASLDSDRLCVVTGVGECGQQSGANLPGGIRSMFEVVRSIRHHPRGRGAHVSRMEVGDNQDRSAGVQVEEGRDGDERVGHRPVLGRRLEAAENGERLRMREHGVGVAGIGELTPQPVE